MLLRSITKHVKEQNWFAVFLDFFIVVVGILIAFQITNWSEARQDRAEEYQALQALKDNVAKTEHDLSSDVSYIHVGQESLKVLAEYSDGKHNELSIADIDKHLLYGVYTLPVTYDELRNTGRLGLISNAELRKKLQVFSKGIDALARDEAGLAKMSYEISDPFLIQHVDWRGFTAVTSIQGWQPPIWIDPLMNRRDYKVSLRQSEFQNIVLYRTRLNMAYLISAEALINSLVELESMINQHLEELEDN